MFDELSMSFRIGNVPEIARYFDSSVEMKISEKQNVYSRNQAEMILHDFFDRHQPRAFVIIHRGASAKGTRYVIGNLTVLDGTLYRVTVSLRETPQGMFIQELTLENQ